MQFTLNITGSLEEITSAINAISKQQDREKQLFSSLTVPVKTSSIIIPSEPKVHKKKGRKGYPIEIHMGSRESGFVLWKIYNTMQLAAEAVGAKQSASIIHCVNSGTIYKGIYKFYRHK